MNKNLVFFMTDCFLRDRILKKANTKTPLELATAIHNVIKEDGSGFSDAIICGFANNGLIDTSEIELYTVSGGNLTHLNVPNCAIAFPSPEPMEMLMHYIHSNSDFSGINCERMIENSLKDGNTIFDEINQKYPLILKPLHIAKLNRDGFVWLQHENKS